MIQIKNYKEISGSGSLKAIFNAKIPDLKDIILRDMSYFVHGEKSWVNFPGKQYESEGKKKYYSYVSFDDFDITKRLQAEIHAALIDYLKNLEKELVSEK